MHGEFLRCLGNVAEFFTNSQKSDYQNSAEVHDHASTSAIIFINRRCSVV